MHHLLQSLSAAPSLMALPAAQVGPEDCKHDPVLMLTGQCSAVELCLQLCQQLV